MRLIWPKAFRSFWLTFASDFKYAKKSHKTRTELACKAENSFFYSTSVMAINITIYETR